jgi:hypothetical protein
MVRDSWSERWRILAPDGAVRIELPRSSRARHVAEQRCAGLPSGAVVVLVDARPGSRRRIRRWAGRAGVRLSREYLALPSLRRPAYLVEDAPQSIAYFASAIMTVPPGWPWLASLGEAAVRLAALSPAMKLAGTLGGRVAVGNRE